MTEEEMKQVRELIKTKRKEKKLSQKFMAEKLGISQNHYSQIESGTRNMNIEYFFDIMKVLGVDNFFKSKEDDGVGEALVTMESQDIASFFKSMLENVGELKKNDEDIKSLLNKILDKIE